MCYINVVYKFNKTYFYINQHEPPVYSNLQLFELPVIRRTRKYQQEKAVTQLVVIFEKDQDACTCQRGLL